MSKHLVSLTLIGHDQAGVIARITQLLFQLGGNIEGLEEQVTRGRFSMTLQASWTPASFDRPRIEREIRAAARCAPDGGENPLRSHGPTPARHPRHPRIPRPRGGSSRFSPAKLGAQPVVVIGSRPSLGALARKKGLPFHHVPFTDRARAEGQVLRLLEKYEVDFIVLARFMKILSPNFVWRWKNKIINIHPSLLPAFPGASAYRQAYERGVKIVGVTAHFCHPEPRRGPDHRPGSPACPPERTASRHRPPRPGARDRCVLRAVRIFLTKRLDVHWGRVYS